MEKERAIVIAETKRDNIWSVFDYYAESADIGFFDNRFNSGFIFLTSGKVTKRTPFSIDQNP